MRKISGIIIAAAALLLSAATSCQKDDTLRYGNVTMGNVVNGRFVSDQGNIFNVVDQTCAGKLEELDRAIISCDVLKKVNGAENEYDVRLNQMASVFTKAPVKAAEITDEDALVQNPIYVDLVWFAGGYANMYIIFMVKEGSEQAHLINFVLEEASDGSYVFNLRHNAFGELPQEGADEGFVLAGTYVSFPLSGLITEDTADITIRYDWYKSAGVGLTTEIEENTIEYTWNRSGFEQAPASALATKAAGAVR